MDVNLLTRHFKSLLTLETDLFSSPKFLWLYDCRRQGVDVASGGNDLQPRKTRQRLVYQLLILPPGEERVLSK